jgi:Asp-tRNA(Asn)/Glu-tRNA(Gln) amidotransferase C subunit
VTALSWVSRIGLVKDEHASIRVAVDQARELAATLRQAVAEIEAGDRTPLFSVAPAANRFRDGQSARVSEFSASGDLFENAPAVKGGFFKVAPVLEQGT